jgi:hypothetical protein
LRTYGLQMRIVACATPTAPGVRMRLYSLAGLMTGYRVYTGTTPVDGWTSFTYSTPYSGVPFELEVEYECPSTNPPGSLDHHSECYDGLNCSDDPPHPPEDCEDCYPGPAPRPSPIDPDGFVHDAASVRAGAAITQAIITRAWVKASREIAAGVFAPWIALDYAEVNPQFTVSAYPDKVNAPGYYSFLVPPAVSHLGDRARVSGLRQPGSGGEGGPGDAARADGTDAGRRPGAGRHAARCCRNGSSCRSCGGSRRVIVVAHPSGFVTRGDLGTGWGDRRSPLPHAR